MKQSLVKCLVPLFFLLQAELATAMNLLGFKVCLATEMKAIVTFEGKPAEGAIVTRTVNFDDKDYVTEAKVDKAGRFVLPELNERSLWKHMPIEKRIYQTVTITYNDVVHNAVKVTKYDFYPDTELNNFGLIEKGNFIFVPYDFTCELTHPETKTPLESRGTSINGKCLPIGRFKPI